VCIDTLEKLICVRQGKVVSYEHDGLSVDCSSSSVPRIIAKAAEQGILLKEKLHPYTREEWMAQYGHDTFPELSQSLVHEILEDFLWHALDSIQGERKDWVIDHDAWSRVMFDTIKSDGFPLYVKNREDAENLVIEYWDHHKLKWISAGGARALKNNAAHLLRSYLRKRAPHVNLGALPGHAPFMNPIIEGVKIMLPSSTDAEIGQLNGDTSRGLLRFEDGQVLNFMNESVESSKPQQRISFSTKMPWCPFVAQHADHPQLINAFVIKFMHFVSQGGQSIDGNPIQQMANELRRAMPKGLYSIIWSIFENDDVAIWMIRQICRGCAGFELLEEFLFFFDERGLSLFHFQTLFYTTQ
jgi:hypothetical protein